MNEPLLAAILVAGANRATGQDVLDALCSQTAAAGMEIAIVDTCTADAAPLQTRGPARIVRVARPGSVSWGTARLAGMQQTTAPVVAFLEDHCIPKRDWAERLIEAHRDRWAVVGYAFTNANPATYISRACMLADYGRWEHPAPHGTMPFVQSNNVSYKRSALLSLGGNLERLLCSDYVVQEVLRQKALPIFCESGAVASHHNFTQYTRLVTENLQHARTIGALRAEVLSWPAWKRLLHGLATPALAPWIQVIRLAAALRRREDFRILRLAASMPVLVFSYACSALGESLGYLFGADHSEERLTEELLRN